MGVTQDTCILFDANNVRIGTVEMPARSKEQAPRNIVWQGRKFREGDRTGFYDFLEFREILPEAKCPQA